MTKTIGINGMMCAHCEARMKKALEALDGVACAVTSHEKNNAVLELTKDVPEEVLRKAVTDAGYEYVG
ncbi:MAG: cation transporter [Clostridia bacterium]|nr:cation transporter [Clostridia bacterium]